MAAMMAAATQITPSNPSKMVNPRNIPRRIAVYLSQTFLIALVYVCQLVRVKP